MSEIISRMFCLVLAGGLFLALAFVLNGEAEYAIGTWCSSLCVCMFFMRKFL